MSKTNSTSDIEVKGFLGMDLGYAEEAYVIQSAMAMKLVTMKHGYTDYPHAGLGWVLLLVDFSPRDAVLAFCRKMIKSKMPIVVWGADEEGYLIALWGDQNKSLPHHHMRIHETFAGLERLKEVHRDFSKWSLQFLDNLGNPEHKAMQRAAIAQSEQAVQRLAKEDPLAEVNALLALDRTGLLNEVCRRIDFAGCETPEQVGTAILGGGFLGTCIVGIWINHFAPNEPDTYVGDGSQMDNPMYSLCVAIMHHKSTPPA